MLRQFSKGVPGEGHRLERETSSNILLPFQPAACTRHIFIIFDNELFVAWVARRDQI